MDKKSKLNTVSVPESFQQPFIHAQKYVAEYFLREVADPTRGARMRMVKDPSLYGPASLPAAVACL